MSTNAVDTDMRLQQRLLLALDECWTLVDDTIDKQRNVLATNQRNDELESKFATELKLNSELRERLQQINKNSSDLDKMCNKFAKIKIKDSDQLRLDNAQEMLSIGKEYTTIRWDYAAPPNVTRGYLKNSSKMFLECFEYKLDETEAAIVTANLWKYIASAASADWKALVTNKVVEKENVKNN